MSVLKAMTKKIKKEPDFDERLSILEDRFVRMEGEFYQFHDTITAVERGSDKIYRITWGILFLAISISVAAIIKMSHDLWGPQAPPPTTPLIAPSQIPPGKSNK